MPILTPPPPLLPHRGERGISAALILACATGHWIEELVESVAHELDEPDSNGATPIMHALMFGQSGVARKLIARGVDVDDPVPPKEKGGAMRTMLMVAVQTVVSRPNETAAERQEALDTISDLVKAGALTGIPTLHERRYTSDEIYAKLRADDHVIGFALNMAETQLESEQVDFKYRVVRIMLAAAFREAPGAALCAFVALNFTMREHADRVYLSDNELALNLQQEAVEVGISVGSFVKTLPDLERERLLRSIPGDNFLRFGAESDCRKMFFSSSITNHIGLRWSGELALVTSTGEGVYQWGGRLPLTESQTWLLTAITPLVWLVNILLLPVVAVYPPFADLCREYVDKFGVEGVDPRDSPLRPEGKPGYSPTMRLWWRSLVLFDVPIFKFAMAQMGSLGLLAMMLYLAPCFDYDNHQECFASATTWHMIGDGGGLSGTLLGMLNVAIPDSADGVVDTDSSETNGDVFDGISAPTETIVETAVRRMLKGGRGKKAQHNNNGGGGGQTSDWVATPPDLFGLSKDTIYMILIVYAATVFVASVRTRPSIGTAHTYASAGGSALALIYLFLDLVILYPVDEKFDLQPMALSLATFLLWMDVARAILLKTFTCGPSVLMLILMFKDVAVFLIIAVTIAIGFALALFFNGMLGAAPSGEGDCHFMPGSFYSYPVTLVEDLLGMGTVSDEVKCAKTDGDIISQLVLELYLVVGTILLLNMLIAMMGETFADVRSRQEEEYNFLNSQIVISVDMEMGNVPPPLSFFRAPMKLYTDCKRFANRMYEPLEDSSSKSDTDYKTFTHVSAEELIEFLDEADMESDKADLPNLIIGAKDAVLADLNMRIPELLALVDKEGATKKEEEEAKAKAPSAADVIVYDGYHEEASRLVFHYSDHFQDLPTQPEQRTYLPSGVSENEAKKLPIYIDDEAPDKKKNEPDMTREEMHTKLKARALTSYPFAQKVPMKSGKEIIEDVGDSYVYLRDNGEYGLSQIWPIKVNKQFENAFVCSTTNPNPKIFQPQAVAEFKRTLNKLLGPGSTERVPVIYAKNTKTNTMPIYKGTSEQLQLYLQDNPAAVDRLKIAKLYPGGFVATVSTGGNPAKGEPPKKDGYKEFDFTPGEVYVLYTKQGYESMACVKSAFQFEKECELGKVLHEEDFEAAPALQA